MAKNWALTSQAAYRKGKTGRVPARSVKTMAAAIRSSTGRLMSTKAVPFDNKRRSAISSSVADASASKFASRSVNWATVGSGAASDSAAKAGAARPSENDKKEWLNHCTADSIKSMFGRHCQKSAIRRSSSVSNDRPLLKGFGEGIVHSEQLHSDP